MPASKNTNYPLWTLTFEEYWVKDNETRHTFLLSFCKDASIIQQPSSLSLAVVDHDTLNEICKDPIISRPFDCDSVSKQRRKKFHHFRQCVLAELLLALGVDKDTIHYIPTDKCEKKKARPLSLVKRYIDSEKEGARIRALQNYFDGQHWSIVSSPISKYETERKKEKEGRVSKENANTNIINENRAVTNNLEMITPAPAMVIVTPTKSRTHSRSLLNAFEDKDHQLISHEECTHGEEINASNEFIMESGRETEIAEDLCNRRSNFSNLPRVVSPLTTTTVADKSNNMVRFVNLDCNSQCESQPQEDAPKIINKFGLRWHLYQKENDRKVKKETLSRDAKKLLVFLNEISLNDIERASEILKIARERLSSITKVQSEPQIPKELISAGQVVNNIRKFLNREQFLHGCGGRRDDATQHVLSGIWCAMSSPSFHYISTEYGIGRAIEFDEDTNMHKIDLGWGCLFSPASSEIETSMIQPLKLKNVDGPSSYELTQLMGMANFRAAMKGKELRDSIELGQNVFKKVKHQKSREDNVHEQLKYAVNKFCHDPQFVRPDNYCKQLYKCRNLDGSACKHQRHNWYHTGSIDMQHQLFLESEHYAFFSKTLCDQFPLRFKSAEDTYSKASLQSFKRCVRKQANCVKEETRASCVDPIEAKSYDLARSLQMYFNMQYNNTKRYLKEEDNNFEENYQINFLDGHANNDDCDSIDDEEEEKEEEISIPMMMNAPAPIGSRSGSSSSRMRSSAFLAEQEDDEQQEGCSASSIDGQTLSDGCDFLSLSEKFDRCKCEDCLSGKQNWFELLGPSRHGRPHRMLLDAMLCPRVVHHDLSLEHEKPIKLHNWKCGKLQCNECGIDRLPWNCSVVKDLDQKISVWIWEKDDAGHSKESTKKVRLPVNQIFLALKEALTDLSKHIIQLEFLNRQRYLNLMKMPFNKAVICTDFSAQMDLVPVRKLSCHVNKHASLGVFCIYLKRQLNLDGKDITYIDCHDWYVFGSCDEKGKKNDWIFHTAALKYIVAYYREHNPSISSIDLWTDNCPGQYKCRQNLYQVAKFTKQYNHLQRITHQFAMQYGFKGKHDTAGNYIKSQIRKLEMQDDTHAFNAEAAYKLAKKYVEKHKSVWEQKIKDCHPEVQYKSPHETSQRFVAFMEDDESRVMMMKKQYPDGNIIHSNRKYMQQELEDIEPIKDIKSYYKFWHCLDDDKISEQQFQDHEEYPNVARTYTCKFCQKKYKSSSTSFNTHVQTCKLSVELGMPSILRFQRLPCYCSICTCGGKSSECKYVEATGIANYTLLTSISEQKRLQELSREKISRDEYGKMIVNAIEAVNILIHDMNVDILFSDKDFNLTLIENLLPSMLEKNRNIKMPHYEAIAKVLQVDIRRSDGQIGKPRINDYLTSLEQNGGWKFVILSLLHILEEK